MSAPRVALSPVGSVVVRLTVGMWVELVQVGDRVDELRYLDADEVADWPVYGEPS